MPQTKTRDLAVKDVDEKRGTIVLVPTVFGVVDDGKDRAMPGSWLKTLRERLPKMRMGYQHDVKYPLGYFLHGTEIGRDALPDDVKAEYPEATGGVEMIGQVRPMHDEENVRRLAHIASGNVVGSSYMYDVVKSARTKVNDTYVRDLLEQKVIEVGPVTFGMNEAARVDAVKELMKYLAGSFEELADVLSDAVLLDPRFDGTDGAYVCATYPDRFVMRTYTEGEPAREYEVTYTMASDGTPVLGDAIEVEITSVATPKADPIHEAAFVAWAARQLKAGRVISQVNMQRLAMALDAIKEVLAAAEPVAGTDDDDKKTSPAAADHSALREQVVLNYERARLRSQLTQLGVAV